ncbi:unnamed protein product [Prunus brigantina]
MYTGAGIPRGSLILSSIHLEHVRFPLHPLFHMLLFFLGLHPMQLNPNSYLLIFGFLAVGLKWGVSPSFKDFIYLYDLACVKGESHYFFFPSGSVLPSDKRYLIPEDRITWLEENLVGQGWDITHSVDHATLIRLSTARRTATYLPFILADSNMREIDLFKDICSVDVELC